MPGYPGRPPHTPLLKLPSWRSVCVLYSLCVALLLPDSGATATTRCGRELVADLEFVCGDRGFYRGKPGGARNSPRARKGIVEMCCVKGCDLQHLESYCATPKRGRREASPQQRLEEQFWLVFQKRYQKLVEKIGAEDILKERALYRRDSDQQHHLTETLTSAPTPSR